MSVLVPKNTSADSMMVSGKRRVRVNGKSHIASERRHFNSEHAFGDQLTSAGADKC